MSLSVNGVIERDLDNPSGKMPTTFDGYQYVEPGDLLMCLFDIDVTPRCVGRVFQNGVTSPAYSRFKLHEGVDLGYYYYYYLMMDNTKELLHLAKNLRHSFTEEQLGYLKVPFPPLSVQQEIATFLDAECVEIDKVIKATKESIEEYKALKQAVIADAVTHGIRDNRELIASGMDWVQTLPATWNRIPSKFLFKNSDTRRLPEDEQLTASQKYGIITQTRYMELENAKIVLANKGLEDWKHVDPNDFIISLRSFQGGLEMSEVSGCITWHYIVLKPCKPICSRFFKWLFKSELYIKALQRTCNYIRDGQDLRYSNFVQVPLFEPAIEEQEEIADYLDKKCSEIDTLIKKKEAIVTELENYKKSLIYEYVTGKKEVPADVGSNR